MLLLYPYLLLQKVKMSKFRLFFYAIIATLGLIAGAVAHLATGKPMYFESVMTLVILGFIIERIA